MSEEKGLIKRHEWWWHDATSFYLKRNRRSGKWNGQTEAKRGGDGYMEQRSASWKDGLEITAWRYELVRRLCRSKLSPWTNLDHAQQQGLKQCIGESYLPSLAKLPMGEPQKSSAADFRQRLDDLDFTAAIQFNLRSADSELQWQFKEFIKAERKRKRISKPDKRPRNTVSWRWLEVWDLSEREGRSLDSSASSMKVKAKREAEKWQKVVLGMFGKSSG